jgi:hypothetical protein
MQGFLHGLSNKSLPERNNLSLQAQGGADFRQHRGSQPKSSWDLKLVEQLQER